MFKKKGQVGVQEMILTVIVAGILFAVGLLIFANVSNTAESILDPTSLGVNNESLGTITVTDSSTGTNSTLITGLGYIADSEQVINNSGAGVTLLRNIDYSIAVIFDVSGGLLARGNFTLLNATDSANNNNVSSFNNSPLNINYRRNIQSAAQATTETLQSTVLDSFALGVIALIVLAAVVILAVLFRLGQ